MPKIIENLEVKLMEEAHRQVDEVGYGNVTIRSIASACNVGIGTVYNYFSSKDALLATYLLNDWNTCIAIIEEASSRSDSSGPVTRCIYDCLKQFSERHRNIFRDVAAVTIFQGSSGRYHGLLRSQLAAPLQKFYNSEFAAEFVAEALLTWTMAGRSFDEIFEIIKKI